MIRFQVYFYVRIVRTWATPMSYDHFLGRLQVQVTNVQSTAKAPRAWFNGKRVSPDLWIRCTTQVWVMLQTKALYLSGEGQRGGPFTTEFQIVDQLVLRDF